MELVFVEKNLAHTAVADLDGNTYVDIVTHFPNYTLAPITGIDKLREVFPQKTLSQLEVNRRLHTSNHRNWVGFIAWKTRESPALFHHDLFGAERNKQGVSIKSFMKREGRNMFGGYDWRVQTFKGNDDVWYRWKIDKCYGSVLTKRDDNTEVARVRLQRVSAGVFQNTLHTTISFKTPDTITLDFTLLLMTFLWLDHPRLEQELGKDWAPEREERFLPGPDFFYPDQERPPS